jgi:putative endonuclease (uncharacterized protein DUF1780)
MADPDDPQEPGEPDALEREYVARQEAHARKAVEYLSERNKPERERAVCRAFLRCVGVPFADAEIVAPAPEPIDVMFRAARFQVCDRLEPGARRDGAWKARLARATHARTMDEAIAPWPGVPEWTAETVPMSVAELTAVVTDTLKKKARHYGQAGCADLDALVYADLTWSGGVQPETEPGDTSKLQAQGWRSVSVLFPPVGIVLCARAAAPGFLRAIVGTPLLQWPDPEIFEA